MHIKQITIEGFKSYKDQTTPESFHPRINVVVGPNGSGKSNFFAAIRFVLDDCFNNLKPEERLKLLHEGTGHAVTSAYVEMVFDNSDGRIQVDKREVRLRRTIGAKRDEFTLDRKAISKQELQQLLEGAGFSRSNPYYVVQQGKIMTMSTMKDKARLELLKEIGGTKVYEERRADSIRILAETTRRLKEIEQVMSDLDARMKELDEERQELTKFRQLDATRRSVQYAIYDMEVTALKNQLEKLDQKRKTTESANAEMQQKAQTAKQRVKEIETEMHILQTQIPELRKQHDAAQRDHDTALQAHAACEVDLQECRDKVQQAAQRQGQDAAVLTDLETEVQAVTADLQQAQQAEQAADAVVRRLRKEETDADMELQALYKKQGGRNQFESEAARDDWVGKEIEQLRQAVRKTEHTMQQQQEQQEVLQAQMAESQQAAQLHGNELAQQRAAQQELEQQVQQLQQLKSESSRKRKELWQEDAKLKGEHEAAVQHFERCQKAVEKAVPREINRGLNSVKRIVKQQNIRGVYGTLMEVFQVPTNLTKATEVAAGQSLFHIVCDTEETALRVTQELNKQQAGRATFMPVNRLKPPTVQYPTEYGTDAVPVVKQLKFSEAVAPAVRQVFGRTMLCKDLDVATTVAAATNLNCVSIDGDEVNRKGTLTGGFIDSKHSKLAAMRELMKAETAVEQLQKQCQANAAAAQAVENEAVRIDGDLQKLQATIKYQKADASDRRQDDDEHAHHITELQRHISAVQQQHLQAQSRMQTLQQQISSLQAELGTPLTDHLSPGEQRKVTQLNSRLKDIKDELLSADTEQRKAAARVQQLHQHLDAHLMPALVRTRREMEEMDEGTLRLQLTVAESNEAAARAELSSAAAVSQQLEQQVVRLEAQQEALNAEIQLLKTTLAQEVQLEKDEARILEDVSNKASTAQQKKADYEKKIKELGSLPAEAFDKYAGRSSKVLHDLLAKAQQQLKALGPVNVNALEQYSAFVDKRHELQQRRNENQQSEAKINQLIHTLDLRKDECIERTFRGVAKEFSSVFSELVPGGQGQLVMQTRHRQQQVAGGGEDSEDEEAAPGVDRYTGVKVKVSFGSGETMLMKQLSGGQKTLVALALIFAIQRCDPAPFYLFDEIDAALDPAYRTTVAKMLRKQADDESHPAQFIITTFHPQIVQEADSLYGVSHRARVSSIASIRPRDALEFLQAKQQDNRRDEGNDEAQSAQSP